MVFDIHAQLANRFNARAELLKPKLQEWVNRVENRVVVALVVAESLVVEVDGSGFGEYLLAYAQKSESEFGIMLHSDEIFGLFDSTEKEAFGPFVVEHELVE
jgi:hypothetical protein